MFTSWSNVCVFWTTAEEAREPPPELLGWVINAADILD